jgi:hypothetical protein
MKIIPTTYEGIEYRSKTEAAWAAYLTYLGVNFEYEPEAFDLGSSGYYLPDFYLNKIDCFIEIKPTFIVKGRESPVQHLAEYSDKKVYLIQGQPREFDIFNNDSIQCFFPLGYDEDGHIPCICPKCGDFGIEYQGRTTRINCGCVWSKDGNRELEHPKLKAAVKYALSVVKWRAVK